MDNIEERVEFLLAEFPETRESDEILYMKILERDGRYNFENINVLKFFRDREKAKVPSFKSVERARRKVQSYRPDLMGSKQIQAARKKMEKKYHDYYGGC